MNNRPYLCRAWLCDDARDAVLTALDAWAKTSGLPIPKEGGAWIDPDLPVLFKSVDAQVDRLIERAGVTVTENPSPFDA